jgi:zinc/manganese transport system substrate-binding protein
MLRLGPCVIVAALLAGPALAQLRIVAAENFYGDVARQLAGADADAAASILSSPERDPASVRGEPLGRPRPVATSIVVYNGADYGPWMTKL